MRVNVKRTSAIWLWLVLFALTISATDGKVDLIKANSDQLCPTLCSCSEQKPKFKNDDDRLARSRRQETSNSTKQQENLGTIEILKYGIKVQCQNTPSIQSIKNLNLPNLLIENMFQLDLSGNRLTALTVNDFSLGNYSMLQRIILKNNQIEDIAANSLSKLKNLKYLDLSNNLLKTFSASIIRGLGNLERIKLNGNPIYCDCQLRETLTFVSSHRIKLLGTCSEPARFKEQALARLILDQLPCDWPPVEDSSTIEIKPTTNQIVFEGDPLKLSCKLKTKNPSVFLVWLQHSSNETISVSASATVDITTALSDNVDEGTVIESFLQIRNLLQENGGRWTCASVLKTANFQNISRESRAVQVTVLSLSTPTCPNQVTVSNKGRYSWPRTMANVKMSIACQSNPHMQVWRRCNGAGEWEDADVDACSYLNEVTKVLEQFAKTNLTFSKTSALESARRLKSYLIDVVSLGDPHDAIFVTQTLHNYLEASGKHPELLPIIMDIYSILIKQEPRILMDSRHGLTALLQQAPLKTPQFHYRSSSVAVEKSRLSMANTASSVETCIWHRTSAERNSAIQLSCSPNVNKNDTTLMEAAVRIPLATDQMTVSLLEQSVVLSLITGTNPFINPQSALSIATAVVGITSGHVTNLINRTVPFVVTLRVNANAAQRRLVGARWNPYKDTWSVDQCQTFYPDDSASDWVTFQCCCGFGFFAALVDDTIASVERRSNISGLIGGRLQLLPAPVYVGSVMCVLSHVTTVVSYVVHQQQLHMTQPSKHALINGWISMALIVVVFTLGVRPLFDRITCQVVGLLLHYLTLSSLLWMVVNASSLYKHLTKASQTDGSEGLDSSLMEEALTAGALGHDSPTKPALRFYLIGWGVPLIVVGIAGAIHLDQYFGAQVCFLAWTPSLGAVGLPSSILIFLILTFHLLTWCYMRHTSGMAKRLAAHTAATLTHTDQITNVPAETVVHNVAISSSTPINNELSVCVLDQSRDSYLPLIGNAGSCPSNLTQATHATEVTEVTEVSDLTSLSSCQERSNSERIALLIDRCQRGEAEGAQSANEVHSGRSDIERPLLVTSSSDDRLEVAVKGNSDGQQGHSNPLMASSDLDDSDAKKKQRAKSKSTNTIRPIAEPEPNPLFQPDLPVVSSTAVDDADETPPLIQLRGQMMSLLLFCLTWISALCVVTRPFRTTLPYDELIFSLSYAVFSASAGLHTLVFYLLTRNDISAVCCSRKRPPQKIEVLPPEMLRPPVPPPSVDEPVKNERNKEIETIQRVDMNVTLDPATLLNSFYDARQSKTARRFFQKQKLLQSQNNNQQQVTQQQYPTEEALLNLSSSSKAKVNNVNIHVELGAYDWHELQTRMSDHSWTKSGKQLPSKLHNDTNDAEHQASASLTSTLATRSSEKSKRKRGHGLHQRTPKKSKWEDVAGADGNVNQSNKPVYVFVNYDYRDRALAQICDNDAALKTLTAVKIKVKEDCQDVPGVTYLKRETSV